MLQYIDQFHYIMRFSVSIFFKDIKNKRYLAPLCLIIFGIATVLPLSISKYMPDNTVSDNEVPKAQHKEVSDHYAPVLSVDSGFYDDIFELEMNCADPDATIFYTIDGSVPTETSLQYTSPVMIGDRTGMPNVLSAIGGISPFDDNLPSENVTKGFVIRAAALLPDGNFSSVTSRTYFVGVDREALYGDAPVISLYIDPSDLFGYENGIYVLGKTYDDWMAANNNGEDAEDWEIRANFTNTGKEWERAGAVEFLPSPLESETDPGFSTNIGVRIMGGQSRYNPQKSFRLKCREEYGAKNIKYEIIPDNIRSDESGNVKKYKSFILRNGGNDCDYLKFRDAFIQDMASDLNFDNQASMPVVVFVDGEYWGCYVLCEDYNDNYIENNYGINDENVVIVKRWKVESGTEEDLTLFNEMYDFITSTDMSDPDMYEAASGMLDMPGFAEFCALNIYIYNEDSVFIDNNWQMWRVRDIGNNNYWTDGKWRILNFDTEFSTGIYSDGTDYDLNMMEEALSGNDTLGCRLLSSLIKNDDFRKMFINALCDMRNVTFEKGKVDSALPGYCKLYEKLVPDTLLRFGPVYYEPDMYFDEKCSGFKTWLDGRYDVFTDQIMDQFGFDEPVNVTVRSSDPMKGGFSVNTGKTIFESEYTGKYFTEVGFTIHAVSNIPARFDHWEVENGSVSDPYSVTASVIPEDGCTITAVYR